MTRAPSSGCGNTQLLTLSSVSLSEATKSSVVARDSAMSITMAMVAVEAFLAERRAKTLRRTSHSGWFGFCLAKRGKYLRQTGNNKNLYTSIDSLGMRTTVDW